MKKVLSISLGSSSRDHRVETEILGETFIIERRGTNGNKKEAYRLFTELDGEYDSFGLGGIDLYIYSGQKRYTFRDAKKLITDVKKTPIVDGSGLKNTLERRVINYINEEMGFRLKGKKVLMVSAVDRFGMAEAFIDHQARVLFGDLIFALGLPIPLYSLKALDVFASILAPVLTKLPFELVYPTGDRQEKNNEKTYKFIKYYQEADIIAGDYHFIKKYLPESIENKIVITNTVTSQNIKELGERGASMVITTTPELNGRSFGTNVMEGVLVALSEKSPEELSAQDYIELLDRLDFTPRIIEFNRKAVS